MTITYVTSASGLTADQPVGGFFEGWAAPLTANEHLELLHAATHVVLAIEDGQVVGFVSALSDGVLSAYIPLLEVLSPWRGRGIGGELVRRILSEIERLYMIDVMCDADTFPFYERLGFQQASGGVLRHYDWRTRPGTIP